MWAGLVALGSQVALGVEVAIGHSGGCKVMLREWRMN